MRFAIPQPGLPLLGELEQADQALLMLLQAIGLHVVAAEPADLECFQLAIQETVKQLRESPKNRLPAVGTAIALLQQYSLQTAEALREKVKQRDQLVAQVARCLVELTNSQGTAGARMTALCQTLEQSAGSDARQLQATFDTCLAALRKEVQTQRAAAEALANELRSGLVEVGATVVHLNAAEAMDSVTDLPGVSAAVQALAASTGNIKEHYIAAFVPNRIRRVNERFGMNAGNQVLVALRDRLLENLSGGDLLFRWRGPCIICLMRRKTSEVEVGHEVVRLANFRAERIFEVGNRLVLVPVSCSWKVMPLSVPVADACDKIDRFVSSVVL
jgi:GGDEF domain-containing protein